MTAPKLVLYNSNLCPYAARAVIALAETGLEHEVVPIDLAVPRPEWYLKDINPYGQVPALKVDDQDVILESLFVAEYVSDISPESGLLPADALQRAQIRYLIHHWGARVQPSIHKATFTLDKTEQAQQYQELLTELVKFNALLKSTSGPYFLGEKFTLADLAIAPFLARFFLLAEYTGKLLPTKETHPELEKFLDWKEAVLKRESVKASTPEAEVLVVSYRKWLK